ncbi:zeta toxin family protein [Candidatus Saccharibacteria bacterium]|nr:zeta toxin family protein [Candidatus Saccharibacteria bacterium]
MALNTSMWIKKHKNAFAKMMLKNSGAVSHVTPSAIFMAGLPGAGKTEFTKNIIEASELKAVRLDMDEIAAQIDGYKPEIADKYRKGASTLLNKVFDLVLKNRLDFIMDGTFASKYATQNIQRALSHDYHVKIIYISQDPKRAWEFTKAREKIEHRGIAIEGFIESYFKTIENLKNIKNKNRDKIVIDIIKKDHNNKVGQAERDVSIDDIDKIIEKMYNKERLKEYLNG